MPRTLPQLWTEDIMNTSVTNAVAVRLLSIARLSFSRASLPRWVGTCCHHVSGSSRQQRLTRCERGKQPVAWLAPSHGFSHKSELTVLRRSRSEQVTRVLAFS